MMRSAFDEVSACASVLATMKSTPTRPETIMLLTALPPAPPTPQTMMRGFNSRSSGAFKLMVILGLLTLDARRRRLNCASWLALFFSPPSKTLLQPAPHARDIAVAFGARRIASPTWLEMFDPRDLRIDHQADS